MDTIWPVIIIMVLMAVLPEMLRKKRRYPTRGKKGPIPIPERRDKRKKVHGPIMTPKSKQPQQAPPSQMPQPSQQKQPVPQPYQTKPQPQPVKISQPAPQSIPVSAAYRPSSPVQGMTPNAPHLARPAAWSGLDGAGREIYAGIVWSELLQPPVALRRGRYGRQQ